MTVGLIVFIVVAFLISGIPFGLILTRAFKHKDVRTIGSGNIGATNVLRAAGPKVAGMTLILDVSKSFLPVLLAHHFWALGTQTYLVALASILGHIFSPYLKFKGGKGVATLFGTILAIDYHLFLIALIVFVLSIVITKYVSVGSLLASLSILIYLPIARNASSGVLIFAVSQILAITIRHRSNIARILGGVEPKIGKAKA